MVKIINQSIELLDITPNAEQLIEKAGRTCYKSEDKITDESAPKFIQMIQNKNHVSVIEHAHATFRIICDRGISHEIVRHRIASFSQESSRYCDYGKEKFGSEITVIQPPGLTPEEKHVWQIAMEDAECAYFDLITSGQKPQIARSVLPTCLKTEIVMTANFREWYHFLTLRTSESAHPQIREIASMIATELYNHGSKILFEKYLV